MKERNGVKTWPVEDELVIEPRSEIKLFLLQPLRVLRGESTEREQRPLRPLRALREILILTNTAHL